MARVEHAHKSPSGSFYPQTVERGLRITHGGQVPDDLVSQLEPRMVIRGPQRVLDGRSVLNIGPLGSRADYLTCTFQDGVVLVTTGCFTGLLEEFAEEVSGKAERSRFREEYDAAIELIRVWARWQAETRGEPLRPA